MKSETRPVRRKEHKLGLLPSYVHHRAFGRTTSEKAFDPRELLALEVSYDEKYMPDDVTKEHAKFMHYAAHRMHTAETPREIRKWQQRYNQLRDRIVLGNRKLIYRAVKRRMPQSNHTDDLIGDCHIVLIHAVAAFNPWIGIRFSTYAFTCLIRALSRISQRSSQDRLARALSFDSMPESEPFGRFHAEPNGQHDYPLAEFLRNDHPLLTEREKTILNRRFRFEPIRGTPTLEVVGRTMGLSKERVRQVQTAALEKLRKALTEPATLEIAQ